MRDMGNAITPCSDATLLAELQAAYERWVALCTTKAHEDGEPPEVLEQELGWMRWRLKVLRRHASCEQIRNTIRAIERAEAWVAAGRDTQVADEALQRS